MRASLEWLREFVPGIEPAVQTAHRLTMLGLEVEAAEDVAGDTVFEVNVTPNRPDCLSIIGIARELSAALGTPLLFPEHEVSGKTGELDFNIDILNSALCRRYAGRIVKGVKVGPSPDWLRLRLEKSGVRSINNVVDVTNYVLIELGHPLHAFDLGTIKGRRIQVGTSGDVKGRPETLRFRTLDGLEHELPSDALLIWDAEDPIAVAGVMGGQESEVNASTSDIFIESAWFDPVSVRRTSRVTGLKTEASFRFERGTDIKMLKKALDRAAFLMHEIAGGTVYGKIDIYPGQAAPQKIGISYQNINRVIGLELAEGEIKRYLDELGFVIEDGENGSLNVMPPAYRVDVRGEADIIEEIARVYGYDRIPAVLPMASVGIESQEIRQKLFSESLLKEIKESFLKSGFTEVINYSFMGDRDLDLLGFDREDARNLSKVPVKNPLSAEDAYMRTMLVSGLIRNIVYNVSRDNRAFRLFEISRVFFACSSGGLPEERNHFAAALYKEKMRSLYKDDTDDFFVLKGVIEALFEALKIGDYSFARSAEPFLHPGQAADLFIGGSKIGFAGALSPVIAERLDIKAHAPSIILAELDIDLLRPYSMQAVKYHPLPKYPCSERDTALVIDEALASSDIISMLKAFDSDLIEDVTLFDVYKGKNIPDGKKSIAFSIRYRASDRTLKDDEVDALHNKIVAFISGKTNGQLRG